MQFLINILIALGSILMVYNIIRYVLFFKKVAEIERGARVTGFLTVPLILLTFFLIGYIVVGLSGLADLMIASILFGGSVFVFLLLIAIYTVINRIQETEALTQSRYDETSAQLDAITKNALSVFRVNLTRDLIEDRGGRWLYSTDSECDSYTDLMKTRSQYVIDRPELEMGRHSFLRDDLIQAFLDGQTSVAETLLVRHEDDSVSFVRLEAMLTKMPVTGDIIAYLIENPYNDEIIHEIIQKRVLPDQFDRVAYLVSGSYHILISNAGKKDGLLIPDDLDKDYQSIYLNYILPAMVREDGKAPGGSNPLRLSVIDEAMAADDRYETELPFRVDGKLCYKRFLFYCIDRKARFYLMLLSDSTSAHAADAARGSGSDAGDKGSAETIKAADENAAEVSGNAGDESAAPDEAPCGSGNLLLVDDNPINREIAGMILTSAGYSVDMAGDGAKAVEMIGSEKEYDLVLMDVNMPVMNGYEATAVIRAMSDPAKAGVPIVALTASDDMNDIQKALDCGMNAYASKPIDPDGICRTINSLISGK
ncbi:MAG: response regulator [Lachnospiraceae bacterium]|nr:response regulator [Lachnospiraceae bacterium]